MAKKFRNAVWLVTLVSIIGLGTTQDYQFPANEYEYSMRRDWLLQDEKTFVGKTYELTADEQIVDQYLQHLKWQEFLATRDTGFPPARPIEEMMDHILASEVYRVLLKFPKGGNMHSHENHEVSKLLLLQLCFDSEDFQYLYFQQETHILDFFATPPDDTWINIQENNITIEELYPNQTLIGVLSDEAKRYPSDSGLRWRDMNPLWGRGSTQLINNIKIKESYLRTLYQKSLYEGVQYLETRKFMGERIYIINPDYPDNNGKEYLDEGDGVFEVDLTLELLDEFIQENPSFIGHKRISYTSRRNNHEDIQNDMNRTLALHLKYPDHILGFDLVGEEDAGFSHLFYFRNFLEMYDEETQQSKQPFYMHTVETSWPSDLITGREDPILGTDPVGTNQNMYDAILLGARRLGHGLGVIKHPYILDLVREKGIAIEICPVSNQILGFLPDLRNHPAIHYFRSGIPVILGADDPGSFGYDHFTIDWYDAFMAWGLDLGDLRQFALNSLNYSAMTEEEKDEAINVKWLSEWNNYIETIKEEACNKDMSEFIPEFGMIVPQEGAATGTTRVHLYGRNFDSAICNDLKCQFGEVASPVAQYVSNNHIVCEAPDPQVLRFQSHPIQQEDVTVSVSVDFGDGNFINTGHEFTYKYEPYTTTPSTPPTTTDSETDIGYRLAPRCLLVFLSLLTGWKLMHLQ